MSELLTTGQIIDRLKVGEVAESGNMQITKYEDGTFVHLDHPQGNVVLYNDISKAKWHILPNYVSFEEAIKALFEGKEIAYHAENQKYAPVFRKDGTGYGITKEFGEFVNVKWTIEEERI